MKADTPDLELRKAIAEKIGWTHVSEEPILQEMVGLVIQRTDKVRLVGIDPSGKARVVPPYELSVDALLRDAVPWARAKGFVVHIHDLMEESVAIFSTPNYGESRGEAKLAGHNPAKAVCQAFLELP